MNYFNYYSDIEETFVRRRGKHLMISPKDWALISAWEDRGIPLHIVLRAVNAVFDAADKQPHAARRMISSLTYCTNEVEAQYNEYLAAQVGKSGTEDDENSSGITIQSVEVHITAAIEKLQALDLPEIKEDLSAAVAKLAHLSSRVTGDFAAMDAELNDIEKTLDTAMLTSWNTAEIEAAEIKVRTQLEPYKAQMDVDAYKNTFTLMLLKALREKANIPRLGLFYL